MSLEPRYTLLDVLHEGGGLHVYRGARTSDGAPVIVKVLAGPAPGGEAEAMLRHEHRILQGIDDPSVPRVLGLVRHDGRLALVLEGSPGRRLDAALREGRPGLERALAIGAGITRALAAVHRAGVIHRNVKPTNVIIDAGTGAIRLIDFSIAARRGALSASETFAGTPAYIAPEQTGLMERGADTRSDLYALGVTLYELLTGRLPFLAADLVELVHAHLARAPAPPRELDPSIPEVVSDIVLRLLRKAPEDRYQSAAGLLFDLEACLAHLRAGRPIEPFALGARDAPVELSLPEGLFGREDARAALREAYERASQGSAEIAVLIGAPGIGKSALLHDLAAEVGRRGGRCGTGKCEQTGRAAPYAPFAQALGDIFRTAADEEPAALARLRDALDDALGPNCAVLIGLVPEAALVLGPRPPPPELEPIETKNRLVMVIERALAALTAGERPLALVLDDVQWIDAASLELLKEMLPGARARRLLLVLAAREGGATLISEALAELRGAAFPIRDVPIGPLDAEGTAALVAEVLRLPAARVREAAAGVLARTGGNPLAAITLLRSLHEAGALAIDPQDGQLEADFVRAGAGEGATDVAVLLVQQLRRLSLRARRALVHAACLGHTVDVGVLSAALGTPEEDLYPTLDEAARQSFVLLSGGALRFAHDRVQRAALALVGMRERRAIELAAGRRLRARAGAAPRDEDLFAAVDLLNEAAAQITDPEERAALARDDLRAGQRALARAAFAAGRRYLEAGAGLLDEETWARDHELAFALLMERCECEAASGDAEAARASLLALDRRARDPGERLRMAAVRIGLAAREGRNGEAVLAGCEALRVAGIDIPAAEDARRAALDAAVAEELLELGPSPPAARLEAPEMSDPIALAVERVLMAMNLPAYFVSTSLFGLVVSAWVALLRRHGHSRLSGYGYACYGAFLTGLPDRGADAHAFGRLALTLIELQQNRTLACRVTETVAGNILFLHEPLRDVLALFPPAMRAGLEAGDLLHVNHITGHIIPMRVAAGDPLPEVVQQADELLALVLRYGDVFSVACMRLARRTARELSGEAAPEEASAGADVDALFMGDDFVNLAGFYHTQRLMTLVVRGAWQDALAEAEIAEARGPYAPGQFFATELAFFAALARLQAAPPGGPAVAAHREALRAFSRSCPATFRARTLLVEAEAEAAGGDELLAMRCYDEAIAAAREGEMLRDEALAAERCAEFHARCGRARVARAYLEDALVAYRRWGAAAKVRALEPRLFGPASDTASGLRDATRTAGPNASPLLDATAVIRAAQAIATELTPARVMERLLRIAAEVAGAERAMWIAERDGRWIVEARLGPAGIAAGPGAPLEDAEDLPVSVVRQVARTSEPVLLADAAQAGRFAGDPYITGRRLRSVLCMEAAHGGRRAGVVYLENNAARGAFARDRLGPIGAILAQAAIAMENAQLYERLEATMAELRRANAGLTEAVAQRTEELRRELTAREEVERARAVLAEEMVEAQRMRLAELSAPILPIAEGVILIPLLGTVDAARATDVLEAALHGASAWSARAVILDVTGMKGAGAEVAAALLRATRALGLLGAEAVITGFRPEAARALVDIGAELGGVTTRRTLRSGIAYALRRATAGR